MSASLKAAFRSLRHSPGFTLLAVGILALGIGATTAMFSITRTILLKPLAYRQPERLVAVMLRVPALAERFPMIPVNARHYHLWRERSRLMEQFSFLTVTGATLSGTGDAEQLNGSRVSINFFDMLGVQPAMGRAFVPEEGQAGKEQVVVISDGLWRRKFGGATDILGRRILLDGKPYQVVGVTSPWFPFPRGRQMSSVLPFPENTEYWRPLVFSKDEDGGALTNMNFLCIARFRAGASPAQLLAELTSLEKGLSKEFPPGVTVIPLVTPLQESFAGPIRRPLLILLSAVGLVLLIVCINLMNLMLVRATGRRRDWAIRLAMGASVRALMAETFLESLLLSFAGGAMGCVLAVWLLALVRSKAPFDLPRIDELAVDPAALLFALAASFLSAVLFGLWPAWRAAQIDPQEALRSSSRSATEGRQGQRVGQVLVAAEVALSVVLLLGAGLLLRSFVGTLNVNPGLQVQHLLTAGISLPPDRYKGDPQVISFYKRLLAEIRNRPGVREAGLVSALPVTGESNINPMIPPEMKSLPFAQWPMTNYRSASPSYFHAAAIPMVAGRSFDDTDGDQPVVVISESLAKRLWPGQSATGRTLLRMISENREESYRVIGVVGDVRTSSLRQEPALTVYFTDAKRPETEMSLVVRTSEDPSLLAPVVRRVVAGLDSGVPVTHVRTMDEIISDSVAQSRFQVMLLSGFAIVAVILACLGIYGVLAFTVSRRTSEIGIRMALGAWPDSVRWTMLRQGMLPVLVGLAVGLAVSMAISSTIESLLFSVKALDPFTYVGASLVLLAAAAVACIVPAERAARLSPVEALRNE
jgi:predicted permease